MKQILYVQYTDPAAYPPLEHSSQILAQCGWAVRFLGVEADGAAQLIALPTHPSIEISLSRRPPPGALGAAEYLKFLVRARREILTFRPQVVYCSDVRSYPVGLWATRLPGVSTILHEHDTPPTSGPAMQLLSRIRRTFARRASLCILPQDERARSFLKATGARNVSVVYNCPRRAEVTAVKPDKELRGGLVLWYHGSIGSGQLPITAIDALARLPDDVRLEFAGYETVSTRGYVEALLARAEALGIAHRVRYIGAVPLRAELLRAAAGADLGLCLFATKFREPMVGASNKPFDYLACGLPLITNDTVEWKDFFASEGVAVGCDPEDQDAIARVVLRFYNAPAERRAMAARGRELIRHRWNYETQFEKIVAALEGAAVSCARGEPIHV